MNEKRRQRLEDDVQELREQYKVKTDIHEEGAEIHVKNVDLPTFWKPGTSEILFEVSELYPNNPPEIYIPENLSYAGHCVHKLKCSKDGYNKWCREDMDWDPVHHTLDTLMELLLVGMRDPHLDNPYIGSGL